MHSVKIIQRDVVDRLGEGLLWSVRDRALYWVDILGQRLYRLMLDSDQVDSWDVPEMIGWVIERRDAPGFIAGLKSGFAELTIDPLTITPIATPEPDMPGNRMNDAVADALGRIWAGTMPVGCDMATGSLYRLDTDRSITKIDSGYTVTNGPVISPDGGWLYHTDSPVGSVYRYPLDVTGEAGAREPFIQFEAGWGHPDGMTIDRDGGIWIAHWGGSCVSRFTPAGVRERSIQLPTSQITNCVFAGEDLDRMFVTSAADGVDDPLGGALFEIDPGCVGLPARTYAG
jgi:D-xylonolactonase